MRLFEQTFRVFEHKFRVFYKLSKGIYFVIIPTISLHYKVDKTLIFESLKEVRYDFLITWLIFSYKASLKLIKRKKGD